MPYTDPERRKAVVRKSKWKERGVNPVEAEILFQQKAECALCKSTYRLHVDHCHKTKALRGVLCHKCNLALGLFEDDTARLAKAIDYLNNPVYN